jgi:hypothetical protein
LALYFLFPTKTKELKDVLLELVQLVEDSMKGAYEFDSFSLQPAYRILLMNSDDQLIDDESN